MTVITVPCAENQLLTFEFSFVVVYFFFIVKQQEFVTFATTALHCRMSYNGRNLKVENNDRKIATNKYDTPSVCTLCRASPQI